MKHILNTIEETSIELFKDDIDNSVCIGVRNGENFSVIWLDESDLYELIGVLHHLQKQLKNG